MASALIVDDSAFIRRILKQMLEKLGFTQIDEATDGHESVLMSRQTPYNVVFMDLMMPKEDGLEAIKQIMTFSPSTNIIVCTSVVQDQATKIAFDSGAKDLIRKPFNFQTVSDIVSKYIKN